MTNTLVVAEEIDDYGATHDEDLVVPLSMLDWNPQPTRNNKQHPNSRPSWTTKKVVLGFIGFAAAVILVSRATVFFSGSPAARTGPESVLLHYPYVKITNKTPYNMLPQFYTEGYLFPQGGLQEGGGIEYLGCKSDFIYEGIPAGETWTAASRGLCLVYRIHATLGYHTEDGEFHWITCIPYNSPATSFSIYSIIMKGEDECCVLSSNEIQTCPFDRFHFNELSSN